MRSKRAVMMMVAAFCAGMFCGTLGWADNIMVSDAKLAGPVKGTHGTVRFNVQWEHSWRLDLAGPNQAEPYNYDAAWVFVKYCTSTGGWKHATLSTNAADHVVPPGCALSVGQTDGPSTALPPSLGSYGEARGAGRGVGVFLYRSANGAGTFTANNVGLRWEYPSNGIGDGAAVTLKVFAIEMVYVPQGSFWVGDGLTDANQFYAGGGGTNPFKIESEAEITVGPAAGNLFYAGATWRYKDHEHNDRTGVISKAFPKGYAAFYGMKYEITQGQYVDFLNQIKPLRTQAAIGCCDFVHRVCKDTRYTISWNGANSPVFPRAPGSPDDPILNSSNSLSIPEENVHTPSVTNFIVTARDLACHWLSWADLAAYLDWAGLRPMTELEYEKACRGPLTPWPGEYAWGNSTVVPTTGIANIGQTNEAPIPSNANCVWGGATMRVGSMGRGTGSRIHTGAGYYGMMDLSGGALEHPVTVGNPTGRNFTGLHGDGALNENGDANVPGWPGIDSIGAGWRGGYDSTSARVSDRGGANGGGSECECGHFTTGGRGVRTAP